MSSERDVELLKRRAQWLGQRSLLELELVILDALRHELPHRSSDADTQWLAELVRILELDDYILLDAITGNNDLEDNYNPEILTILQSYLPGRVK